MKGVLVLHYLVAVRHNTEGGVVCAAEVHFVARNQGSVARVNIPLLHAPVETGVNQSVNGRGGLLDFRTQAVPGLFPYIKHGFNIRRHKLILLSHFHFYQSFSLALLP